jgi:hypothetical protein
MDISSVEQFCIGIIYVYKRKIKEDFLQFEPLMNVMSWKYCYSGNCIRMSLEIWYTN